VRTVIPISSSAAQSWYCVVASVKPTPGSVLRRDEQLNPVAGHVREGVRRQPVAPVLLEDNDVVDPTLRAPKHLKRKRTPENVSDGDYERPLGAVCHPRGGFWMTPPRGATSYMARFRATI